VRSLSDIAAMGGAPRFCLIALCVPGWASAQWVDQFFDGALALATESGTVLAGGDLSHGEKLACDVTVGGAVPRGTALRRDGARAGHDIYVSGLLGGSALGLHNLGLHKKTGKALRRHLEPEPRISLGRFLREKLRASSAIDLSDGLSLDLRRVCEASGLDAAITSPPQFPGASMEQALHGGEDYELLFTVPGDLGVPPAFEGLALTRIGSMVRAADAGGTVFLDSKPLAAMGYDHFTN
jgi:thiamine-monophosphate kinase